MSEIWLYFPLIYCMIFLISGELFFFALPKKTPADTERRLGSIEAKIRSASARLSTFMRIVIVIIASVLLIADFIMLAILNYNQFYWLKIAGTICLIFIPIITCLEVGDDGKMPNIVRAIIVLVPGIIIISFPIVSFVSFYSSEIKEGEESRIELWSPDEGTGKKVTLEKTNNGLYFRFYQEVGNVTERKYSAPYASRMVHHVDDDEVPRVVEKFKTTYREVNHYGEPINFIVEREYYSTEIYVPEKIAIDYFLH